MEPHLLAYTAEFVGFFFVCWSRFGFVGSGSVCIKSCKQTQSFFCLSSPFCSFSQLQTPQSSSAAAPGQAPPEPPSLLVQTSCSISKHFPPGQTMDFFAGESGGRAGPDSRAGCEERGLVSLGVLGTDPGINPPVNPAAADSSQQRARPLCWDKSTGREPEEL